MGLVFGKKIYLEIEPKGHGEGNGGYRDNLDFSLSNQADGGAISWDSEDRDRKSFGEKLGFFVILIRRSAGGVK